MLFWYYVAWFFDFQLLPTNILSFLTLDPFDTIWSPPFSYDFSMLELSGPQHSGPGHSGPDK